uniref:PWWP domain-containing protein n=1 Tax=Kwoniella dejecticola CBS 10117 TaxID=1296121 RepID=A0A1A5ZYZ1_9TREE|nr:uncharacterized protein I303_06588 [Kwoniella dejecticola CBS 10117]OBR83029.1 hypothetical protein I303_06588 [Kwoniella dejecticola CBS 10117]
MSAEEVPAAPAPAPEVDASAPAPAPATTIEETANAEKPSSSKAPEEKPKSASPDKKAATATAKPPSSKPRGRPSAGGAAKKAAPSFSGDEKRQFKAGEIVLARLRGYPPWPARIADPDTLPRNVLKQRPGKNPLIFCCQFFPAGDFSWLQSKEIKPLSSSEISSYLAEPHRKATGGLREAYQTAQDPTEWDGQQADIQQAKEEAENEADEDELEEEDEEEEASGAKKRKRAEPEKKKAGGKKAKTAKSKPAAKPKAAASKGSKAPVSKPENQEAADDDPLASNPECVKVKDWRHKLQRAFLSKSLPSAEEMPSYDDLFKTIESYEDMTIDALQYSKIGKVMKKIMTLNEIPRNDDFKITDRASKLMHQWTDFIAASEKPNGNGDAAAANGEKKEEEKKDETEKIEVDA